MISSHTSQTLRKVLTEIHATGSWRKRQVHSDWSIQKSFLEVRLEINLEGLSGKRLAG